MKALSSGSKAASAAIHNGACWYLGMVLVADAGTDCLATVWDSPDTTVTNDTVLDLVKGSDEDISPRSILVHPVWCSKGISVVLDAAEGDYVVWYAL